MKASKVCGIVKNVFGKYVYSSLECTFLLLLHVFIEQNVAFQY
jgi:hypothetical protein